MQNAGLDKAQVGIKIAGRNIKNLRYADDTTLMQKAKFLELYQTKLRIFKINSSLSYITLFLL